MTLPKKMEEDERKTRILEICTILNLKMGGYPEKGVKSLADKVKNHEETEDEVIQIKKLYLELGDLANKSEKAILSTCCDLYECLLQVLACWVYNKKRHEQIKNIIYNKPFVCNTSVFTDDDIRKAEEYQ